MDSGYHSCVVHREKLEPCFRVGCQHRRNYSNFSSLVFLYRGLGKNFFMGAN